jgi:hypothetical protein
MGKIAAYHTNSLEYPPKDRFVYHDHDDCEVGKNIQMKHREPGTGGKVRCNVCVKLG